jgi:hypothetical protein
MTVRIPPFLHDVFGKSQTLREILITLLFGIGLATILFWGFPDMWRHLPLWRSAIAYLLIVDIFAGCIANFTYSTNNHYAARDKERLVFIAIHLHILVVAWLLEMNLGYALIVWGYTIIGAFIVNRLKGSQFQLFAGGVLLSIGIAVIVLTADVPKYFLVISLLFMVKVLFSFAIDHYGQWQSG